MTKQLADRKASNTELNPVIFCDFDGTITQVDVTDLILSELAHPAWLEVEQQWVRGLIGSRECLERQIALVEASAKELNALIDSAPVDPYFAKFYRSVRGRGLPLYVLSDGFDYVIRRILRRVGVDGQLRNGAHLFASSLRVVGRRLVTSFPHAAVPCEHDCATCKADLLRRLGRGRYPIIFIGDGLSDRFAIEEADLVFAKRHLASYCLDRGVAYHSFASFREIEVELRDLLGWPEKPRRTILVAAASS